MSYIGRVEIRAIKDGDYIEVVEMNLRANRDHLKSGYAGHTMLEEVGADDIVRDILAGRTDGVHDIWGAYHEHWTQDYWGESDCDFSIKRARVRFCGTLPNDEEVG